ncbi:Leucine-rich repeat (LRR) family protein [Forsythia ovata]|uniref:Leucine-rich repeat (LRR) family protein n=1 Tax=Forsythia ovata TaxID=205694 RepID=A0ABD1UDS8_9LAMI
MELECLYFYSLFDLKRALKWPARSKTCNKICRDSSTYKGFICDTTIQDKKLRVAGVNFNGYNFDGKPLKLQSFIEDLKDLIIFHVNSNGFTGVVPFRISMVPSLYELDLSNNKLIGEFPKAILAATNLTFLDVRFNHLIGNLPPQVFTLDLDVLYLNNNEFVGNIPENLGKTPSLYLSLANNKFIGPIPKSIGQASNTLLEVLLLNNQLSGCLPYEIGLLKKTTIFDASINHLTGPIPHSFGCLENLKILNVSYNELYGAVPETLCKLSNLRELTLKFNYFTQVGPECRKLIKKEVLDISMNCILDLPSQKSPEECAAFFSKHHSCPDQKSLNYVPCKNQYSTSLKKSAAHEHHPRAHSPSYAALHQHRP